MSSLFPDSPSLTQSELYALAVFYQTHPIPATYDAKVVVASFLVSVLGASTTLLLLGRRTADSGFRNWGLLVLAAVTMASVGIWGMHFIGMNMVLQPTPDVAWYIHFNPGFTVLSLFLPMLALVLAFVFVGTSPEALPVDENEESAELNIGKDSRPRHCWSKQFFSFLNARILLGGILFGGTVALMHYSAGFSASFRREYVPYKVALSIVLACCASAVAFTIFFRFQSQWQGNWWKRLICACVLATAVCGMHYLGLSGTRWYVPSERTEGFSLQKKASLVITTAITVMSFGVCLISVIILFSDFLVTREARRKARRVVIASATFDKAGRVLVNLDGMLPMCEVETDLPIKDFTQELNYRQATFQWIFALSRDWSIVEPFISRITARSSGSEKSKIRKAIDGRRIRNDKDLGTLYGSSRSAAHVALFKDRCLESTHALSKELGLPLSKMGNLFDNVLPTGTRAMPSASKKKGDRSGEEEEGSAFNAAGTAQRQQGMMLFLVRELSGAELDTTENYLRRGFRFSEPKWLSPVLADRAGVLKPEIDGLLDDLRLYAKSGVKSSVRSGGTYLGIFAVRPSISREGGIDTLVYQFARHQIPAYRLPDVQQITDDMRAWVVSVSGRSMKEVEELCLDDVNGDLTAPTGKQAEDMWIFKSSLILAMDAMKNSLDMFDKLSEKSFLSAEIVELPSSDDDSTKTASMVIFQAAVPAPIRHNCELPGLVPQFEVSKTYQKQDPMPTFTFVPYSLFTKGQMMLMRGSGARKFAKECRSDFMKRYDISAQDLQACTAPSRDRSASLRQPSIDLRKPDYLSIHNEPLNERDDMPGLSNSQFQQFEVAPLNAKDFEAMNTQTTSNSVPRRHTSQSTPQIAINFEKTFCSEKIAAPAYSPTRAAEFLQNGARLEKTTEERFEAVEVSLSTPPRRPRTPNDTDVIGTTAKARPCTPKQVSTQGEDPLLNGQVFGRQDFLNTAPRAGEDFAKPEYTRPSMSHDEFPSAPAFCDASSRPRAQPLAITARLRSDDWYSRCMDGIERSPVGKELHGVDW